MGVIGWLLSELPALNSLFGLFFYSLIAYLITFAFSWGRVKLLNDNVEFGGSAREAILNKRKEKSLAAQQLLEAMNSNGKHS